MDWTLAINMTTALVAAVGAPVALFAYLNFCELMASLRQLGEISADEILGLFEYDLRLVTKHPFILAALPAQGFERLPQLLEQTNLIEAR